MLLLNIEKNAYKLIFECFPLLLLLFYFFLCFFLYFFMLMLFFFPLMLLPVFQSSFSSSFFVSHRCRLSVLLDEGVTEREGEGEHFVEWVAYLPQRLIHWHRGIVCIDWCEAISPVACRCEFRMEWIYSLGYWVLITAFERRMQMSFLKTHSTCSLHLRSIIINVV